MEATPPTGRPGRAKRLLSWLVGGPPRSSETARFAATLLGVAFAVYALTWAGEPLLIRVFALCAGMGVALWGLGGVLYRWRETFADLLRLVGVLMINLGLILFIAGLWWMGRWGQFWSALVGYAVVCVVATISILRARTGRDASSSERPEPRD